jgi:3-carboxy-cis,cis-muconate cycloisomerase
MNYQSAIYSKYLSNEKMVAVVSDEALVEKMIRFEASLARAQQKLGIIPSSAADKIVSVLDKTKIKPEDLAEGTFRDGIPVIALLTRVKEQLNEESKPFLHNGVTSQDALDTAQVLVVSDAMNLLRGMLTDFQNNLEKLNSTFGATRCMARTRGQLAAPITFGFRIKSWLQPMQRQQQRLKELSPRVLKVQLGGAVGDLAFFKSNGKALTDELASQLGLSSTPSWHAQRDTLGEFSNWLSMCSSITGKMGADMLIMSQNEIGEVEELAGGGGKSSAMPHKNNPVLSEALVALARLNASLQSRMLEGFVHGGERDATAWILEWETMQQMMIYAAASLSHAIKISAQMKVNAEIMEKNVAAFLAKNGK